MLVRWGMFLMEDAIHDVVSWIVGQPFSFHISSFFPYLSCQECWWLCFLYFFFFFFTCMMWAYVMISVRPADSLLIVQRSKNFNIDIFSDAINVINVKLCMMVLLIELFLFPSFSETLTIFQSHRSICFNWKFDILIWSSWNFIGLFGMSSR